MYKTGYEKGTQADLKFHQSIKGSQLWACARGSRTRAFGVAVSLRAQDQADLSNPTKSEIHARCRCQTLPGGSAQTFDCADPIDCSLGFVACQAPARTLLPLRLKTLALC